MPEPDLDELLALATAVAEEAAGLLTAALHRARLAVGTKTSPTDMVTEVDRASERLIADALRVARPGDAIVGEEGTADTGTTSVRWIVDPLDGTTNYLYGFPAFAVSVAAEVDGVTEVGVVVDAAHGETFAAARRRGATCNQAPVRCNDHDDLSTALVGTGFSYDQRRRERQADVLTRVLPAVRDIRRAGAAAIDLCWVAAGRLDAFYERGLQPWDLAAGAVVAGEAGVRLGDLGGGPASTEMALAAAPGIFEPLRNLLTEAGAATA